MCKCSISWMRQLLISLNKLYSLCPKIVVVLALSFYVYIEMNDDESRHI
jgi:hypothetical protein